MEPTFEMQTDDLLAHQYDDRNQGSGEGGGGDGAMGGTSLNTPFAYYHRERRRERRERFEEAEGELGRSCYLCTAYAAEKGGTYAARFITQVVNASLPEIASETVFELVARWYDEHREGDMPYQTPGDFYRHFREHTVNPLVHELASFHTLDRMIQRFELSVGGNDGEAVDKDHVRSVVLLMQQKSRQLARIAAIQSASAPSTGGRA